MTTDTLPPESDLLQAVRDRVGKGDDYARRLEEAVRTWESLDDSPQGLLDANDTVLLTDTPLGVPWPTKRVPAPSAEEPVFAEILGVLPEAIVLLDQAGMVKYWNRAAEELFGWMAYEVLGSPPPFLAALHKPEHAEIFAATRRDSPIRERIVVRKCKDGRNRTLALFAAVTPGGDVAMSFRAVPPAKHETVSDTSQASSLESLGATVASVSHDFNNVLTAIVGSADLLADRLPANVPGREWVEVIQSAGRHATGLTRRLLRQVKPQSGGDSTCDLTQAVEDLLPLVKAMLPAGVRVKAQTERHLPLTRIDGTAIEQIVLNLATNAGQAMPRGGVLQLRTGEETRDGVRFVVLAIADSGSGMDDETRARLFEPYFTTRAEGTGLGLATVRDLVAQAGGRIELDSLPGLGSVFRVFLPALGDVQPPFGTGRSALVADDDPGCRELVKRILESAGFDVSEAASTDEALQTTRFTKQKFDLLIADVVMPGIGGRALAEKLQAQSHDLAAVLISGYPQGSIACGRNQTYLAKPFTPKQLLASVRAALPAG